MRDIQKVQINKLIVHITEPKRGTIVLSEKTVPLKHGDPVSDYFAEHIIKSVQDRSAKSALFPEKKGSNPEINDSLPENNDSLSEKKGSLPAEIVQGMLLGKLDFVLGSQLLAQRLYDVLTETPSAADGDLAICLFHRAPKDDEVLQPSLLREPYLAVIKLDPVGAFRHVTSIDPDTGATVVSLVLDPDVFPRLTSILQKGAYIQRQDPRFDYHLLLVDKQTSRPGAIAKFFYDNFLKVEFVHDSAEMTRRLYRSLIKILNDLRPGVDETVAKYLGKEIYKVFTLKGHFDLDDWIDKLALPKPLKKLIKTQVTKELEGKKEITRNLALAQALTRRRSFYLQNDGFFSIPAAHYDNVVDSVSLVNIPGQPKHFRIVLTSSVWTEDF